MNRSDLNFNFNLEKIIDNLKKTVDPIDDLCLFNLKSFFADKNQVISVYSELQERKTKFVDQTTTDKTVKRKRQPFDLERLLKKASSPKWKSPTDKKWKIITDFYADVNGYEIDFPLLFLVVNHWFINENSLERVSYLFERHSSEKAVRIIETFPIVLGCSLERTNSIYQFLNRRHGTEQTNKIVETLPNVLSYSLERTNSIYQFLDSRHRKEQTKIGRASCRERV